MPQIRARLRTSIALEAQLNTLASTSPPDPIPIHYSANALFLPSAALPAPLLSWEELAAPITGVHGGSAGDQFQCFPQARSVCRYFKASFQLPAGGTIQSRIPLRLISSMRVAFVRAPLCKVLLTSQSRSARVIQTRPLTSSSSNHPSLR